MEKAILALKAHRTAKKMTQNEMARKLGITEGTYSKIERGVNHPSSILKTLIEVSFDIPYKDWEND